ncbi:unnamed protein product, partial [Prorocentrum cordatum]
GEPGAARRITFVIRAQEGLVPTKTNAFDVSALLVLLRQRWLARCVGALVRRRGPGKRLLEVECVAFQRSFRTALNAVGAWELLATLYCPRHGGAGHDRSMAARTLEGVQQRGGWRAFKSVARYERHGRASLELQKLGEARVRQLRRRAAGIVRAFKKCFAQRCGPPTDGSHKW